MMSLDKKIELAIRSLLHDIDDIDISKCMQNNQQLSENIANDDISYIISMSNSISAFDVGNESNNYNKSDKTLACESIFNVLNGNNQHFTYKANTLDCETINYPDASSKETSEDFYKNATENINKALQEKTLDKAFVNSIVDILETNFSFVPSSTQAGEYHDISLFDQQKLTAGLGLCIFDFLQANGVYDYKNELINKSKAFFDKKAFLICNIDVSGIQDFIYTISNSGALKGLRARSFYLEILIENIIDELLETQGLFRTNLLYSGGGHAYLLFPNTDKSKNSIDCFCNEINSWLLQNFKQSLYLAWGYCTCSANELSNSPNGSYRQIFQQVSESISKKKSNRYTADDIIQLNKNNIDSGGRECRICLNSSSKISDDGCCEVCDSLQSFSSDIFTKQFFAVVQDVSKNEKSLMLPFDKYLVAVNENDVTSGAVRCYSKNKLLSGKNSASRIWTADYCSDNELKKLAEESTGIERLAVLRADVDNLGKAFVAGFSDKNSTITRTSVLSRSLSAFFKFYMNSILSNPKFVLYKEKKKRNSAVIYSGGDDVFVVGAWDDIVEYAIDLHNSLDKFSQNTLSISAGIGMFSPSYPISAMARQTGELEDYSKEYVDKKGNSKNAVTLFNEMHTYSWGEFIDEVLGGKFALLKEYFDNNDEHGTALLYNILSLIRDMDDGEKLNIARFAYLLARLRPKDSASENDKEKYTEFSSKMYDWAIDKNARKQLITAIYLYVYLNRKDSEGDVEDV